MVKVVRTSYAYVSVDSVMLLCVVALHGGDTVVIHKGIIVRIIVIALVDPGGSRIFRRGGSQDALMGGVKPA